MNQKSYSQSTTEKSILKNQTYMNYGYCTKKPTKMACNQNQCTLINDNFVPCEQEFVCSGSKRQQIKNWFKNTMDKFDSESSCSSMSNVCEMPCQEEMTCEPCQPCAPEPVCQPCQPVCKPKMKTCYHKITEQVQVPCKKLIRVPKQITCYRKKCVTEQVPVTKKVWKCENVQSTKCVKKAVKEPYCKTIMVPKLVSSTKTINVTKKLPYQVCYDVKVACEPKCQTVCREVPVCEEQPVCNQC